ncbi:MAG: tRNA uracil 4-sulfurtransferase ThiI [Ignisphaera sp.]|uniref:Probable tRNA sulfurtransferase n=1 Tax=Ignisphaera aggregans TaxID=334771 RepID=A0A7J3I9W7_9CREN
MSVHGSHGLWLVLVRYGEISLKSRKSRARMEQRLVYNIRDALQRHGIYARVRTSGGRIWICCFDSEEDALKISDILSYVMGIVSSSPAYGISFSNLDELAEKSLQFFKERAMGKVFAVRARRVGVHNFTSKDVEKSIGALLLKAGATGVDLENPQYEAHIEIRGWNAYLYDKIIKGFGGLPIGVEGRVLALFSGGIDSPVATWFTMKRGCEAYMVFFNIGSEKHVESVVEVARILASRWAYGYKPRLYVVDVKPFVVKILQQSPEEYIVIVLRRLMGRLAERLAYRISAHALVTGESLGQVASQTLANIHAIEEAISMPILRPLIGLDKEEITALARKIGTYEYSIKVEELCPLGARRTTTRASLDKVRVIEEKIGIGEQELDKAVESAKEIELIA